MFSSKIKHIISTILCSGIIFLSLNSAEEAERPLEPITPQQSQNSVTESYASQDPVSRFAIQLRDALTDKREFIDPNIYINKGLVSKLSGLHDPSTGEESVREFVERQQERLAKWVNENKKRMQELNIDIKRLQYIGSSILLEKKLEFNLQYPLATSLTFYFQYNSKILRIQMYDFYFIDGGIIMEGDRCELITEM